jgi:ribokinase
MSVVVVGAYTRDLYMFGPRLPNPGETVNCSEYAESHGGKGANQAVAAARLGAHTTLITRLGKDTNGQMAYELFRREGLDMRHIIMDEEAGTGVGFIIVDKGGLQLITTYAGASARLSLKDLERARLMLESASVLLLQGEISAEVSLAAARLAGERTIVILDPSPVETFPNANWFGGVDILTPNEQEAAALVRKADPDAAATAAATGVPIIIITRGADGAEVFHNGQTQRVPAPPTQVVDTTGAGDAFNGALAASLDRGFALLDAMEHACRCASFCVSRKYCIPSYPTLTEAPWR